MIDAETVKKNINSRFEQLYHRSEEGFCWPYACIVCDEFLKPNEVKVISEEELLDAEDILSPSHWNKVARGAAKHYHRRGSSMLLSPRAILCKQKDKRKKDGFSICNKCLSSLNQGEMPRFAIANNYAFGEPPDCLKELTQVELALLTPVKCYGYCFTYTGGKNMKLKGSLTYFKVEMEAITRAVMTCDVLGLHKNIVVLLHGKMTPKQRKTARMKNKVRVKCVMRALKWLLRNHAEWKKRNIDLKEVRKRLRNPVMVDKSKLEEASGDSNVESTESFKVFFPDGTMSSTNGGQENIEEFKKLVKEAKCNGFNVDLQVDLDRKICADFRDSNLVNACLLQFPYGRGGIHETRKKGKGCFGKKTYIEDYVAHLSKLSQPQFHTDLFTLILYNMVMKNSMVTSASWKVRDRGNAEVFAQQLTMEDVTLAINRRESGRIDGYGSAGNKFVSAVDAVTRDIPHTNAASRRGRGDAEAMQHHFGMPHVFLTVNPDDADNFLLQVFTGVEIDDDQPVSSLSENEVRLRLNLRNELRIKYPGICAYFYDCILEIVIEEVIGWNLKTNTARIEGGLFGVAKAFTSSTEEQGRTSLHCHFLIWIENLEQSRKRLYSESKMEQYQAEKELSIFVDRISTCSLFNKDVMKKAIVGHLFPHKCKVHRSQRELPKVIEEQHLRYLRHRIGEGHYRGRFADCVHCGHRWTNPELVESYLLNGERLEGIGEFPNRKRLRAMTVEYQKSSPGTAEPPHVLIEAAYNHHIHAGSACFSKDHSEGQKKKGGGKKRKRVPDFGTECRYRYPQPASKVPHTLIRNALEAPIQWYNWDGTFSSMHIKEVIVKRHAYDGFQNVSCPAISHSKICCNTNVALITPGPIGQYTFKYNVKMTQDQETDEYGRVKEAMQKTLSKLKKDASDASIAIQRILSATFAHQKTNVVGGAMASHLTRKKSRFMFSHKTIWCPLNDLKDLLNGRKVGALLNTTVQKTPLYICSALHYLCRPTQLDELNVHDFFAAYEVVRANSWNSDDLLWPHNHQFTHPSYQSSSKTFCQGVKERDNHLLPKVLQSQFPDTAQFGGSIFDDETIITTPMEKFSEQVLLLFHPFRNLDDLEHQSGSPTRKLREIVTAGQLTKKSKDFLQNLIDAKANCFRAGRPKDPLERSTTPFMPADATFDRVQDEEEDDEECLDLEGAELDKLLHLLGEHPDQIDADEVEGCVLPESLDLSLMRNKGYHDAGYEHIAKMNCKTQHGAKAYECSRLQANTHDTEQQDDTEAMLKVPKKKDLISILINKSSRRTYSFHDIIKGSTPVHLMHANGSVESILDWAKKAKLDSKQRRAFEIITGTFILAFFNDVKNQRLSCHNNTFAKEKKLLEKLVEQRKRGSQQLICVLHGPGGCGKTTAIDLVVAYSKEYCSYMKNYEFTSRTIVITAMTGVAATLLLGDTTHKALYLNQKLPISTEQVMAWEGTKLLIIDEISFASKEDFAKIHARLQTLKQQIQRAYGGLDVIFSGDFRQLEPVGEKKKPVYAENCPEFKLWTNCFIELEGMHRFKNDIQHGERLRRFRDGKATAEDIVHLNQRVVQKGDDLPEDIRYATYFNRDRDSINAALFEERCVRTFTETGNTDDSIMIFSDNLRKRISNQVYVPYKKCQHFWENCGEDHCKIGSFESRIDPVLRLFTGCRVLLPDNSDVKEGLANGTQAFFEKAVLKPGVKPRTVLVGSVPTNAVFASEVEHVVLRHQNERIEPQTFHLKGKKHTFKAAILLPEDNQTKRTVREGLRMTAFQIPMLINNATTGHKLQGSGVDNIFVHNWSYVQNWPYVMLSRVKTESGLYMRRPLRRNLTNYAVPNALLKMLRQFRKKAPTYWTDAEYKKKFVINSKSKCKQK